MFVLLNENEIKLENQDTVSDCSDIGKFDKSILFPIIAELSTNSIFEYRISENILTTYSRVGNEYVLNEIYKDIEAYIKKHDIIHQDDYETFECLCQNIKSGEDIILSELRLKKEHSSDYEWNKIHGKTIFDVSGKPEKVIGMIVNISKNKEFELKLIAKAERDPLTKIYNKVATRTIIRDYLRVDSHENFGAMMIIDVDNFKHVNDNLGHLFGDSILIDLSQEMQDLFRSSDVVGRIGGDEFLVFLRGIKQKKHIEEKALEICKIFEQLYAGETGGKITGSLGISIFPQDGTTYEELFKKADVALYRSKILGKNRYTLYQDCEDEQITDEAEIHVNRYKRDIPIDYYNNVFDSEITDFAFDIMNKTKDVSSAIVMLLSKVGKHFDLSSVNIVEITDQPLYMKYTYQWCISGVTEYLGMVVINTEEQMDLRMKSYDENDIRSFSDIEMLTNEVDPYTLQFYKDTNVKALLECAIFDSGEYRGYVSFNDHRSVRNWTIDEVKTLKTISKIVSSYLLKMRAFERANKLVETLTNFDKLTGTPRVSVFRKTAKEYINNKTENDRFVVIYTDFNNFKYINEKLGAEKADGILISFSDEFKKLIKENSCTSRIYSDKFVFFAKINNDNSILNKFIRFIEMFTIKERFKNPDCSITVSAGICFSDECEDVTIDLMIDNANIARKQSKAIQDNNTVIYKKEMKREQKNTLEITNEAEQAIVKRDILVYYQPKISLKDKKVVGAEALVRWKKPDGSLMMPNDFIPYLEKSGYIINLDFYVYEEVCKQIRKEIDSGNDVLPVSVNVSKIHLKNDDFIPKIMALVRKYRIPAEYLEFELTESVFLDNQDNAVKIIDEMRSMGFLVSIDDFGAGFSSFNLLKNLPVDVLKLDKEFFGNTAFKNNDTVVISSIINMANKMNIDVLCEGVETEEQVAFLKNTDCHSVQGFYFEKAVPVDEFENFKNKFET